MKPISAPSAPDVLIGLTPQQCAAAIASGVLAGAGTGKTKTLTTAVGYRITARRIPATRILAVTFTNKAAAEMTARIRTVLGGHTRRAGREPFTDSARVSSVSNQKSAACGPGSRSSTPTMPGVW
jgi:superfamily I DNA/RNA helicase